MKIQISQQLALERQAFQATMTIDNGVAGVPLTGINVNMNFTDPSGNAVRATSDPNDLTALFFFRLQNGSSIPATIPGASSSTITWLIVPSLGAAGPNSSGQFYSVGATLSYLSGGQTNVVQVSPATISVLPLPDLMLDYFLPSDVYGDDPFTEVVEPPIPFSLGVRVKNTGYGVAESLRIQSAQPQIIDNKQGLLVSFQILGSEVNGQPATPSLLANFGDIQPNRSGVARWIITSTLSGRFISFTASFTHSDDLGGKLTSLISNVTTHVLVHDVLVDLPGRDNIRDFLALDGSVLRVYESQNADTIVADQSATGSITGGGPTYTVTTTPSSGFIYLKLPDPLAGTQTLRSAVRADGKTLNPANAWLSQTQDRNTHLWSYFVNVFDVNNTAGAAYTLQYAPSAGTTNHPPHLNPINNWTVAPGNYLSFPITATDPDANSLTYSFASTPPSGATLDPTTGQFSWRPTQTQASTTNLFTVQVTDNGTPNLSDTGSFTVIVTSATTPPAITAQPLNQTNNAGTVASFTVSATGSSPLSYQWYKNTTNLLSDAGNVFGSTNATLSISNVLGIDAGDYSATISNAAGIVISSNATLVVIDPIITNPPISLVQTAGMTAQFSVGAFGTQPLSYQWQSNGADLADGGRISGSTSNVLTIVNLVVSDTANYQVLVTNVYGSTNVVATLTVLKAIPSLTWTNPVTIPYGTALSTAQLNASANVPGTFVFSPPAGTVLNAGSNSLSVVFTPRDAANFSSATDAVSIVVSPAPLTVTANDALRAFGQPNPVFTGTIQGLVNGDNITASYSSAATPNSAPGTYPIVPSLLDPNNRLGNYQSTLVNGTLTVGLIPQISSQPTNESVPLGSNVVFTVAASGTAPLTYQWLKANNLISGATATALSLNAVSDSDAAAYSVAVSNAFGSVTGLVATLIVIDPPAITAQPGSRTNVAGTTASFAVQASGTAPLSYQWQFNGTNLTANSQFSGVTASSLTISNVQAANAGNYTVVVTNSAGTTTSLAAALTVIGPPGILTQPMSQTVIAGTNLSFSVTAFGTPPLNYQWRFQGTNLINGGQFSGVTTPTLTINNVLSANAGGYSVLITNMAGSVTSSVATLTVLVPPTFTSQPQSRTNNVGTTSIFSAAATGTAPLAYQWQLNGLNLTNGGRISGATSNNLSIANVQTADAGSYRLVVTNVAGSAISALATLTVLTPPVIITQPLNQTVVAGTNASFSVVANGTQPLSYQWQLKNKNLANGGQYGGVTTSTLTISNVQTANNGSYSVVVTNPLASTNSAAATLTVVVPPSITTQPQSATVTVGKKTSLSVTASGTTPLNYQWQFNGLNLANGGNVSGATSSSLSIANIQPTNAGLYRVVVSNLVGTVTSSNATLSVSGPPFVLTQPAGQSLPLGTNAIFTVSATGTQPLGYHWRFNGTNLANGDQLSGVLTPTLTVSNIQSTNAGGYAVYITNSVGSTTSAVALLTVSAPALVAAEPVVLPRIIDVRVVPDKGVELSVATIPDHTCRIEVSTDLLRWTPLTSSSNLSATNWFIDLTAPYAPQRFYRAVWSP